MMQSGDKVPSSGTQANIPEHYAFPHLQSVMMSDSDRKTILLPPDTVTSVELKEEVLVEDTPFWESDEDTNRVFSHSWCLSTDKENRNESTRVLGTNSSSSTGSSNSSSCSSPQVLENESNSFIPEFCSDNASTLTSVCSASSSTSGTNIPTEMGGSGIENPSFCVETVLTEQSFCVKKEPVVKSESGDTSAVLFSDNESVLEPIHEVWVQEMPSWESEETDTAGIHSQETTKGDVDDTSASNGNQYVGNPSPILDVFTSYCMTAQGNEIDVNAKGVNIEEPETRGHPMERECTYIDVSDSTSQQEVERGQHGAIEFDEDRVKREQHVVKGKQVVVEVVEKVLEADPAIGQYEEKEKLEEKDRGTLSGRISKTKKKPPKSPDFAEDLCTARPFQIHVREQRKRQRLNSCEVCSATFAFNCQLQRHMRKHTGERPYQCEVCKMSFITKGNLTEHMRKHTGERPYQCDVCQVTFTQSSTLSRHMRRHTGEHPFICNVCQMSFSQKSSLSTHMGIHTGVRPFQCDVCKMSFITKGHLTQHMRKHTGERPFQCDVCQMTLITKGHLTQHMLKHTGERPFRCDVCEASFFRRSHLKQHMWKHSGEHPF